LPIDARANFASSFIQVGPTPAGSGTTLTLIAGGAALMPAAPFNATCWPPGVAPTAENAEIVRVSNVTGSVVTLARAQEGTSAREIEAGWQFANMLTAGTITGLAEAITAAEATALADAASAESKAIAAAATKANTAQAAAEAASIPLTQKGAAGGVASLTAGSIGAQPPAYHASTHAPAGSDALTTADLPASVVTNSLKALGEVEGNVTPNLAEGRVFTLTAKGATTIQKPTGWPAGVTYAELLIEPNGHTVTLEGVAWQGHPISFAPHAVNAVQIVSYNGGTTWQAVGVSSSPTEIDLCTQYGATPATDITAVLQEAIEAITTAGGGTIWFSERGVYYIRGAVKEGTTDKYVHKGQILFPAVAMSHPRVPIKIKGNAPTPLQRWTATGGEAEAPPPAGVTLLSNNNSFEAGVFDVIAAAETYVPEGISNVEAIFEDIAILLEAATPEGYGVKLKAAASAHFTRCQVGINKAIGELTVGGKGVGVSLPYLGNGGHSSMEDCEVYGFSVGIGHSEHTLLKKTGVQVAEIGLRTQGGAANLIEYVNCHIRGCTIGLSAKNASVIAGTLSMEACTKHVVDSSNQLYGSIAVTTDPASLPKKLVVEGASHLAIKNLDASPGPLTLPFETSEIPATPVSGTSYTNTAYRDAVVYIKATTIEKVEVDGFERPVPSVTAGMVVVRAGGTIKVTGTALGTWAWDLL
jgi:hypothetical protein